MSRRRAFIAVVFLTVAMTRPLPSSPFVFTRWLTPYSRPELADLVAAVGAHRATEGRLTGGFAWAPIPVRRGAEAGARMDERGAPLEALRVSAELAQQAQQDPSAIGLAASGSAFLILNRVTDATDALEASVEANATSAHYLSDLSVAYIERFNDSRAATDLLRALDSVERALAIARLPEALFNRSVILERLNLVESAKASWDEFVKLDSTSKWAIEARERSQAATALLEEQQQAARVQSVRDRVADDLLWRWATSEQGERFLQESRNEDRLVLATSLDRLTTDMLSAIDRVASKSSELAILRAAHAAYGEARILYKRDAFIDADRLLHHAEQKAESVGSPLVILARVYRAIVCYRRNDSAGAARRLHAILADPRAPRYASIRGRVAWTLGLLATLAGEHHVAVRQYDQAVEALTEAGEGPNAGFVRMLRAAQQEFAGDLEGAWGMRLAAFAAVDRESPFQAAAQSAADGGWPRAASVFYEVVATMSRRQAREAVLADALRSRARALALAGDFEHAERTLNEAKAFASRHPEPNWDPIRADIDLAEAEIVVRHSPDQAILAATRAFEYFAANKRDVRVPESLLARARSHRARGDAAAAEADLNRGIDAVDRLRKQLTEWRLRALLGDVVHRFGDELVTLRVKAGRTDDAFDAAERLRAWDLRPDAYNDQPPTSIKALIQVMPADTAMLWFLVQEQGTAAWLVRRSASRFATIPAGRRELGKLLAAGPATDRAAAVRLRNLLLSPFKADLDTAETLVIVPDGPIHMVPFAALPGFAKQFLIEERLLRVSPNASLFVAAREAGEVATSGQSALVVGNPAFDRGQSSQLRDLRESETEAQEIARLYSRAEVLTGPAATRDAILAALPRYDVFHFGGHSLANNVTPGESRLVVAGPASEAITASDISERALAGVRLVVLSSCDSLAGAPTRSEGPLGLARAFLSAGARIVVASVTPVEDRPARELSTAFHREFLRTGDAAAALRYAQLALLQSPDAGLSSPEHWAPFVVVGPF